MFYEHTSSTPRLSTPIMLYIFGVIFMVLATEISVMPLAGTMILGFIGGGMFFFAIFTFYNWFSHTISDRIKERNEANAITPYSVMADKLAILRSDQTLLMPRLSFNAEIEVVAGDESGPRYYFRTPGGVIPWEFVLDFMRNSGVAKLCPISRYPDGSRKVGNGILEDREYARLLTSWLCVECLANEAPANTGPNPATWINKDARQRALTKMGITLAMLWPDKTTEQQNG